MVVMYCIGVYGGKCACGTVNSPEAVLMCTRLSWCVKNGRSNASVVFATGKGKDMNILCWQAFFDLKITVSTSRVLLGWSEKLRTLVRHYAPAGNRYFNANILSRRN